nr:pentapeptide repeat-containing protein [Ruminococcus sp.]
DLRGADLSGADLSGANLDRANLRGADLSGADLSGATGLMPQYEFIKNNFESTADGIIAYKTFDDTYKSPEKWKIEKGSVITENVNFNRTNDCGCGINVALLEWVKSKCKGQIWKVLIRWEWLSGVCVPYNTNGKIRCECVELIETVKVS